MANPFTVAVPNIYEALMAGDQGYKGMRGIMTERDQAAARKEAEQALMSGGDTRGALARLIGVGDFQGANALSNFGNQGFDQNYKSEMLKLAQQNANRREEPENVRTLRATGVDPKSAQGQKLLFPKTDTPISATDKKAIFEAEDEMPQLKGTSESLGRALELNEKIMRGPGSGFRAEAAQQAANLLGMRPRADVLATHEWSKIMAPEALQSMANTLKGATTDFELRKFIEMLADPNTDVAVRKTVIERLQKLTERQMQIKQRRASELRTGNYFKPEGQQQAAPQQSQFQEGMTATGPGGQRIKFQGGQWVPFQ
jgi:hypothetical protein